LASELERTGVQLMLVPLGCPYDAAARVLKGNTLETSLPASALDVARNDPGVAMAAPMLMAAIPRPKEGRADIWVGIDESAKALKPWWRAKAGTDWFTSENGVILGSEAAVIEMRSPGDKLYSPEAGQSFRVDGILERSGTSDDNLFFVPLSTAQQMFKQSGRLTCVAVRLHDPSALGAVVERLQRVPGAQVVTMTEMMGTFLNLLGSVRTLSQSVGLVALTISFLTVLNTLLATVVERANELSVMRALGASRAQIVALLAIESTVLSLGGCAVGLAIAAVAGGSLEKLARLWVPLAPSGRLLAFESGVAIDCVLLGLAVGLLASVYPAWRASQVPPSYALREI
jgi:putative ABC transport system permease protein